MKLEFRKIRSKDDINEIIELIVNADPYTYLGLFGSMDKAKKIMPYLLNDSQSVFYKNNYFCCDIKGKIIGLCSFFFHNVLWNKAVLLNAFACAKETFPSTFKEAYNSFEKEFNEEFNVGATTCQVSVKENYRNKGVATFLLQNILDIYGNAPIQLFVNHNNDYAIHLYEKFGFRIIGSYEDYAGPNTPKIKVYKMYRG